ncbi:hypothetical protein DR996_25880 [Vibrio owensii]|nr:hypothetical protein DR996_25880 [Vibrio owensii]
MNNETVSQKNNQEGSDWHRADIVAALKKRGLSAFFKIVVTSCLLIKQPLFLDLDERYQLVCSS